MYIELLDLSNVKTFAEGSSRRQMAFVHPDGDFRSPKAPAEPGDKRLPRPRLRNVTLLLGNNGTGKTTILRSLAAAAFGPAAKDLLRDGSMVRHGEPFGTINAQIRLHDQDHPNGGIITSRSEHRELLKRHNCVEVGNEKMQTKIAATPNNRRELISRQLGDMSDKQANKVLKQLKNGI